MGSFYVNTKDEPIATRLAMKEEKAAAVCASVEVQRGVRRVGVRKSGQIRESSRVPRGHSKE